MKLLRLVLAAAALSIVTTACGSDVAGPAPISPSFNTSTDSTTVTTDRGQGAFGSGG